VEVPAAMFEDTTWVKEEAQTLKGSCETPRILCTHRRGGWMGAGTPLIYQE
jgi:hypothetical protein